MTTYTYVGNLSRVDRTMELTISSTRKKVPLGGWGEMDDADVAMLRRRFILVKGEGKIDRTYGGRRRPFFINVGTTPVQVAGPNNARSQLLVQANGNGALLGGPDVSLSSYELRLDDGDSIVIDDEAAYWVVAVDTSTPLVVTGVENSR